MQHNSITTAVKYQTVEIVARIDETEIGDFVAPEVAPRGTTLATIRHNPRFVERSGYQAKHCLANYIPGLPEATTIVHIPMVDITGKALSVEQWQQAFWYACDKFGVPMWTQSGIKNHTFEFVAPEMFDKLAHKWDLANDGPKFAAYGGLLFSEMDGNLPLAFKCSSVEAPMDGEDGNCVAGIDEWGAQSAQFRAMRLDADGLPVAIGKGIVVPVAGEGKPRFNTTQIKWGKGGNFLVLTNKNVSAHPLKFWISAEPILMLKDCQEVRQFLSSRVQREVSEYLSLLTPERRADLLKRLGGLTMDGDELEGSKRAVIEALRSNMPWCKEIEERVTRFAIKEVCEAIVPSGGIKGFASLMVISDTHGVAPCDWEEARVVAMRIPVTGANAIIPLPRDPFVRGKGMVVTSEVARLASGDADGDLLITIRDKEVVELFRRYLNTGINSGLKPEKSKAKARLTPEFMQDTAIEMVANSWRVGALSVAGWKLIQAGDFKGASELLDMANIEPMTYKHNIVLDGVPFGELVSRKYGRYRNALRDIVLHWHDKAAESMGWNTPRDLAENGIDPLNVASHLDECWNAAVSAAEKWASANPLQPLSISRVARIAFAERKIVISGAAWREARTMIEDWGKYWTSVHEAGSMQADHSEIYRLATHWGKYASRESIAALLVWRPKSPETTGFGLKWHAVFGAGRAVEVIGLHPIVAEAIKAMRGEQQDLQRQEALVDALLSSIA